MHRSDPIDRSEGVISAPVVQLISVAHEARNVLGRGRSSYAARLHLHIHKHAGQSSGGLDEAPAQRNWSLSLCAIHAHLVPISYTRVRTRAFSSAFTTASLEVLPPTVVL